MEFHFNQDNVESCISIQILITTLFLSTSFPHDHCVHSHHMLHSIDILRRSVFRSWSNCSGGVRVPQVTNFCLWATRKKLTFFIWAWLLGTEDFMVRNLWTPCVFFWDHSLHQDSILVDSFDQQHKKLIV